MINTKPKKRKTLRSVMLRLMKRCAVVHALHVAFAVVVCGAVLALGISVFVQASASDRIITADDAKALDADCILVLGAGVDEDGLPSLLLGDRLSAGVDLYERGASDRLLMSGDHGRVNYDEVNAMKQYAVAEGAKADEVFADHAGFSTYESLYRAREVFGSKRVIIVTQEYHLYRALYIADQLGLDAYGVACDCREYQGQIWLDLREVLARNKDFFLCMVQPEPISVGELRYPISGSGSTTDG